MNKWAKIFLAVGVACIFSAKASGPVYRLGTYTLRAENTNLFNSPLGTVTVFYDDTDLYVEYSLTNGARLASTALAVARNTNGIPMKEGYPYVNGFPYRHDDFKSPQTSDKYLISLNVLNLDHCVVFAYATISYFNEELRDSITFKAWGGEHIVYVPAKKVQFRYAYFDLLPKWPEE